MIALIGSSGYIGRRFRRYMDAHNLSWCGIRRSAINTLDAKELSTALHQLRAEFVINCAGYTGTPNVDSCEDHKTDCLLSNAVLPGVVGSACEMADIPFGHVSSGCIFQGRRPDGKGFREEDAPNFSFRQNNCSFYSGTKALGEEILQPFSRCYVWRLRIPFDNTSHPRNYLQKLMVYERLLDTENSLSHLDEFVRACLDSYRLGIPYGTYNLTNPGFVRTRDVVRWIQQHGLMAREPSFFDDEEEFRRTVARAPRSNCVLDSSKAIDAGLCLSPVEDAIHSCLASWNANAPVPAIT